MITPKVSVIMSVYNGADHLVKSVESILVQDGVDYEFIIVNDGSTDESGEIIESFARYDNRIHVIEQENTGLTKALIRGCKEARGKYIARQDVDDISMTGRLKALENILDSNKDMVVAFSWINCVTTDGEIVRRIKILDDIKESTRKLREEMTGIPAHGSAMFRKDVYNQVGGYNKEFYYAQDCDLWLRMAWEGKIGCVKEYLYNLCLSPESISSSRREIQGQFTRLARECYIARKLNKPESVILERVSALRKHAIRNKANSATLRDTATAYHLIASGLEEQNNYQKAAEYYLQAIKSYPFCFRAWRGIMVSMIKRLTS